jgi:hypothetical protein
MEKQTRLLFEFGDTVLFGLLRGAGSCDGFEHNMNFLVNGISIGGGSRFRSVYDFFDDLRILVLFVAMLTFHSAVHDNREDKEHPEKNSNSATKDEGDGSTFPTTQIHKRVVDAINEGSFTETVVAVVVAVAVVAVMTVRRFGVIIRYIDKTFHFFAANKNSGGANERQDPNLAIIMAASLDERQAESLPEKVRDLHCFLFEAMGAARTGPHLASLSSGVGVDSMTKMHFDGIFFRNHQKRDCKDLGNACSSDNSRKT